MAHRSTVTELDEPQLRSIFEKLQDLAPPLSDRLDETELAQEYLDFLAMLDGIKPLFVLGRGLDHPDWLAGMLALAQSLHLHVIEGPYWDATPFGGFPGWYADYNRSVLAPFQAHYVCKDPDTAREARAVCDAGGRLSMTEEARLLGYPECCVIGHYDRAVRYHKATLSMVARLGARDEAQMRALLAGGAAMSPRTAAEIAHMEAAFEIRPAPCGSWNMCASCGRSDDSPSAALSARTYDLAVRVDPGWAESFASRAGIPPGWTR